MSQEITFLNLPTNFVFTEQVLETLFYQLREKTDDGTYSYQELFIAADAMEKIGKRAKNFARPKIGDKEEAFGAVLTVTGGNKTIDYDADSEVQELKKKIEARKALIKAAAASAGVDVVDAQTGEKIEPVYKITSLTKKVNYKK